MFIGLFRHAYLCNVQILSYEVHEVSHLIRNVLGSRRIKPFTCGGVISGIWPETHARVEPLVGIEGRDVS